MMAEASVPSGAATLRCVTTVCHYDATTLPFAPQQQQWQLQQHDREHEAICI